MKNTEMVPSNDEREIEEISSEIMEGVNKLDSEINAYEHQANALRHLFEHAQARREVLRLERNMERRTINELVILIHKMLPRFKEMGDDDYSKIKGTFEGILQYREKYSYGLQNYGDRTGK